MHEIVFEDQSPVVASVPTRSDIACFVGFVARRSSMPLPPPLRGWLQAQGWTSPPYQRRAKPAGELQPVDELQVLPVPIDCWDAFDRLYAWERRPRGEDGSRAGSYLGAAVRSFFAQGGRKCYVIRVADPLPLTAPRAMRVRELDKVLPGCSARRLTPSPVHRDTWHGVGHLFGLPDVSFLCLPDLPEAFAVEPPSPRPLPPPPVAPEQFVECSSDEPPPIIDSLLRRRRAPRCDDAGYRDWAQAVRLIADLFSARLREVQFIASVPIPDAGSTADRDLVRTLLHDVAEGAGADVRSAFVQLAYPWVRSAGSGALPELIEPPDAVLAGVLARNALTRGTFQSAASLPLVDVFDVVPRLRPEDLAPAGRGRDRRANLIDVVSLVGPTPRGPAVLSDVTTSAGHSYRPAGVNRLTSVIVRAARQLGEEIVFETSGERTWARLREGLETVLADLWHAGALRGDTAGEAFAVRCDRTTMTQNDLDAGRIVARVIFAPAAPVERITVAVALDEGGQVSLIGSDANERKVA